MTKNKKGIWNIYVKETKNRPPRPLLVKALSFVTERSTALDLGAGALTDTAYLVKQGFKHVVAVDQDNLAQEEYENCRQTK